MRLTIPSAPQVASAPVSTPARSTSEPRTTTALLLEDDDLVRKVIARILTTGGIEPDPAASTEEARERMADADHDLLISDGMLGDGPPTEILQRFRDSGRPIIVISGYLRDQVVLGDVEDGEFAFLQKPVSSADLLDAVDDALTAASERKIVSRDPSLSA